MHDLLLVSIIVSVLINAFLFMYLHNKKSKTQIKDGFVDSSIEEGSIAFEEALETEINRVERYEDYSFSLVTLNFKETSSNILNSLRAFVRKSDSLYVVGKKIYILFPFLQVDTTFEEKIHDKLVEYIRSDHDEVELLDVRIQECSIHEMICIDELLKGAYE